MSEISLIMIHVKYLICKKQKTTYVVLCHFNYFAEQKIPFSTTSFLQWQSIWFLLYQHR